MVTTTRAAASNPVSTPNVLLVFIKSLENCSKLVDSLSVDTNSVLRLSSVIVVHMQLLFIACVLSVQFVLLTGRSRPLLLSHTF